MKQPTRIDVKMRSCLAIDGGLSIQMGRMRRVNAVTRMSHVSRVL
jgi:hypothetical protein